MLVAAPRSHRARVGQPGHPRPMTPAGDTGRVLPLGADPHRGVQQVAIGQMHDETLARHGRPHVHRRRPAGTAGGIKVTTFVVLFFIMVTELRGEGAVNIFGKRLSRAVHRQAITVVLVASPPSLPRIAIMILSGDASTGCCSNDLGVRNRRAFHRHHGHSLCRRSWSWWFLMFLGRIGPLTFGTAIALRIADPVRTPRRKGPSLASPISRRSAPHRRSRLGGRHRSRPVWHVARTRTDGGPAPKCSASTATRSSCSR